MSGSPFKLEWEILDGMYVITASHVNVEKEIFDPHRGVCCPIIWFYVNGFKPFWEFMFHYFVSEA